MTNVNRMLGQSLLSYIAQVNPFLKNGDEAQVFLVTLEGDYATVFGDTFTGTDLAPVAKPRRKQ